MSDDVLITSNHMQKQAERIKLILDRESKWKLNGNTATFDYNYKNTEVPVTIKGVKSVDDMVLRGYSITVPSTAYDTDTQVSISGESCKLIFNEKINALIQNNAASVISSGDNSSICGSSTNDYITITGGAQNCTIIGNNGNDYIYVDNSSSAYVKTDEGNDYIYVDNATGGYFNADANLDCITVTGSKDCSIYGGTGNDYIYIENSSGVYVAAGADNDYITVTGLSDCTIYGSAGNDYLYIDNAIRSYFTTGADNDFITVTGSSGEGTDSLSAFNSDDLIYINDSDCTVNDSIVSGNARLQITKGTTNTCVVILGKTTGDTVRVKLGAEGAIQTYTIGTGFDS